MIDVQYMILLFLLGAAISMLGMAFQAFMGPGQIFNWWAKWLLNVIDKSKLERIVKGKPYTRCNVTYEYIFVVKSKWYFRLIAKLSKPLGLCPYCNSTWITIIFYFVFFDTLFKKGIELFLLIGIVWFFVKTIELILNKKQKSRKQSDDNY